MKYYTDEVMRWLNAANGAGLFRDFAIRDRAKADPDFAILGGCDDFGKLVAPSISKP